MSQTTRCGRRNIPRITHSYDVAIVTRLTEMCRVEMDVRLAVLYGSVAREDADATSDLDLLVSLSDDQTLATVSLARRLSATKGG